jgi:putative peptidoglycan lipid II flippase
MDNIQDQTRKLTGAAGIVMFATLISRITGFLRTLLISTKMMPQGYSDEFLLAFTLPDLIYDLLAGGAIAAALIPVLSFYITKGNEKTGWKAISTFLNLTVIIMIILEVIFFAFTGQLLSILAAGYNEGNSGDKELLINLTRILLLSAPFMMVAGQLMGILNSYKRFAMAAFGPVIYNLCTIASIAVFGGKSAELTAWGVVIGAAVFFLIQLMSSMRHFKFYKPKLFIRSNAFKKLINLAIPSLISSTIIEVNIIISRSYATYYDEGMLTLLNNANRTWQLPLGIFAQSIGIAILPTLSEQFAGNNTDDFKKILYKGLRVVYILSLPTSFLMMILNNDIIRVMFKWGSFTESQVFYGGMCLLGYSVALVFASMIALMTRAFYSIQDSRTPLISGLIGIVSNYLFNWIFRNHTGMDIAGTALAYSVSSAINMFVIMLAFRKKTGIDIIGENFAYLFKAVGALIPSGLIVFGINSLIRPDITSKISQIIILFIPAAAGLGLYWFILHKIRIPEIDYVNNLVLSKFKKFKLSGKKNTA